MIIHYDHNIITICIHLAVVKEFVVFITAVVAVIVPVLTTGLINIYLLSLGRGGTRVASVV